MRRIDIHRAGYEVRGLLLWTGLFVGVPLQYAGFGRKVPMVILKPRISLKRPDRLHDTDGGAEEVVED